MRLVRQGEYSNTCGHACAAMLANTTLERVVSILDHDRPTKWHELQGILFILGVVADVDMVPCFSPEEMPRVCMVTVPTASPAIKHFVVKYGGEVYDPARGIYPVWQLPFSPRAAEVLRYARVRNVD